MPHSNNGAWPSSARATRPNALNAVTPRAVEPENRLVARGVRVDVGVANKQGSFGQNDPIHHGRTIETRRRRRRISTRRTYIPENLPFTASMGEFTLYKRIFLISRSANTRVV